MFSPLPHRRKGFTLIELLVVIAIIAILIGLLLPAVQKVREAASRMKCQNNLKQFGIAMHSYHDATQALPIGATDTPKRITWVYYLWPYFEAKPTADLYRYDLHFYESPNINTSQLTGITATRLPLYFCPSDRGAAYATGDVFWRSRGNYCVNWGPTTFPAATIPTFNAPFGAVDYVSKGKPRKSKLTDITDGTSNTLMLSEQLMPRNDNDLDWRGDMLNDDWGCTKFMTIDPPNSGTDVMISPYCVTYPEMPCTTGSNNKASARSKHTGGVNVALCDGSIRFVSNNITLANWQAASTATGGEVIGLGSN